MISPALMSAGRTSWPARSSEPNVSGKRTIAGAVAA